MPDSAWALREEWGGSRVGEEGSIWLLFKTHEQVFKRFLLIGFYVFVSLIIF